MRSYFLLISLAISNVFSGQDIDRILHSKPFSHKGAVTLNTLSQFDKHSSNPFTYVLSANYTPEFFGIALPFSMMYSNQKLAYGLPFSQWRFAPSYRRIRAQFGESNVQFSPYSLSGHRFRGALIEIQPDEHWTFSVLYGRLNDYQPADSNGLNGSLLRRCYGAKIAYKGEKYGIGGSFFKAKDLADENIDLSPKENVVLGLSGHWTLSKNILISGDLATSALTGNTNDETVDPNSKPRDWIGLCLPYHLSTAVFHAYKINIGAPFLNIGYEYVDPYYQSLGTYYFANDFENLTINSSHKFKNITVGGRFGMQRDDLKHQKINSNQRFVYAVNLDYSGLSRFFGNLNYSTFQTFFRVEKSLTEYENTNPYANLDTLAFRQTEQHGDGSIGYRFRETSHSQQQIQLFMSLQKASQNGRFVTSSVNYTWSQKSGRNFGLSAFLNQDEFAGENRSSFGLTAFFSNTFSEKRGRWRITVSETQDASRKHQLILKTSASYTIHKKHQLQGHFSQRFGHSGFATMLNISYGYSFGR